MAGSASDSPVLAALTNRLVSTYEECGSIHHLGHSPLPSYAEVVNIIKDLYEILYPGYGRRQNLHLGNVSYHVGDLIDGLHQRLETQIMRALLHECGASPDGPAAALRAKTASLALLQSLPDLRLVLADDVQAALDGDPAATGPDEIVFCYPGLAAITIYRLAHELALQSIPLIPRMMTEYAHSKTGIDIHPAATIGRQFFIDHGTGVVIGATTEIGDRVKIYQGVTLGALSFPKDAQGKVVRDTKRHPTIESDVVIYANATILGGSTRIGHHSVIGSSVWLTRSVEPFTTVTIESPHLNERRPAAPRSTSSTPANPPAAKKIPE